MSNKPDNNSKYLRVIHGWTIGTDKPAAIEVDVYRVLDAFKVADPALAHLTKKALAAGQRGSKDLTTDLEEIHLSAAKALELHKAKVAHAEEKTDCPYRKLAITCRNIAFKSAISGIDRRLLDLFNSMNHPRYVGVVGHMANTKPGEAIPLSILRHTLENKHDVIRRVLDKIVDPTRDEYGDAFWRITCPHCRSLLHSGIKGPLLAVASTCIPTKVVCGECGNPIEQETMRNGIICSVKDQFDDHVIPVSEWGKKHPQPTPTKSEQTERVKVAYDHLIMELSRLQEDEPGEVHQLINQLRSRLKSFSNDVLHQRGPKLRTNKLFAGKRVVITGTHAWANRASIKLAISASGGKVYGAVTRDTDILIVGEAPGSKLAKAEELGILCLTTDQAKAMLLPVVDAEKEKA